MTQNELSHIITVYDTGNFSLAAKQLYISQSALSQSIKKMENVLGAQLFIRTNSGVRPTRFCQQLVALGRPAMDQWNQFVLDANRLIESQHADLEIGMSAFLVKNFAPYLRPVFEQQYPGIKLIITEERTKEAEHLALNQLINLCLEYAPQCNNSLYSIPVAQTEHLLAIPANHPFCAKHPYKGLDNLEVVDLHELQNDTFAIINHRSTAHFWDKVFPFEPIIRRSAFYTNIKDYILHDGCVGFLDELMIRHNPQEDKLCYYRLRDGQLSNDVLVSFAPDKELSQHERKLIQVIKDVLEKRCKK